MTPSASKKSFLILRYTLLIIVLLYVFQAKSQTKQVWLDNFTYWTMSQQWEYELNAGANYLIAKNGWKDYYINHSISWQPKWWCVSDLGLEMHFTYDPQFTNTTELRLSPGQKIIFYPFIKKIHLEKPYVYGRYDYRAIDYIGVDTIDIKQRVRVRFGGKFILNNSAVNAKTFYFPFFFEKFFNIENAAIERFATKDRLVIGAGYAFTQKLRAEFTYYYVRSLNTVKNYYEESDQVYQILVRYNIY